MRFRFFRRRPRVNTEGGDEPPRDSVEKPSKSSRQTYRPTPMFVRLSLATATRDYAEALEAGRLDRVPHRDLDRLYAAMGPQVWSWQRAKRLTSQPAWRASSAVPEAQERVRAALAMTEDVATWERALVAIDAEAAQAAAYGRPAPMPLDVPAPVLDAIEARRAAALERATRRGTAIRGDGSGLPTSNAGLPTTTGPTR